MYMWFTKFPQTKCTQTPASKSRNSISNAQKYPSCPVSTLPPWITTNLTSNRIN